jgi:vacuolar-type H+-ATPase subunit E/Vma4
MGLETLLAAVERDADAAIQARVVAGCRAAAEILREVEGEVTRRRAEHDDRVERELADLNIRELARLQRGHRVRLLQARADVLERIFARAASLLQSVPEEQWSALIPRLTGECAAYLEGRAFTVTCPPGGVGAASLRLAPQPGSRVIGVADAPPGVLARADDGSVTVDNTLAARLDRLRPRLAIELVGRLEGPA